MYARIPTGRFVLGQRLRQIPSADIDEQDNSSRTHSTDAELYMLVGEKDASLTDAERKCQAIASHREALLTHRCRKGIPS